MKTSHEIGPPPEGMALDIPLDSRQRQPMSAQLDPAEMFATEVLLFQTVLQVVLGKFIQKADDPMRMCSSLREDVLRILAEYPLSKTHPEQTQRCRENAIARASELFRRVEWTATISGAAKAPSSSPQN